MKKADLYIILTVLLPALIGAALLYGTNTKYQSMTAEIYLAGELSDIIPLAQGVDEITIHSGEKGYNILRIEADGIYFTEANCQSQICVKSGKFYHPGQMLICLPHRVLVRLNGQAERGIDAIAY
ncbi:MAG: NusG domain II-containing protein [Lachnospiraceae bacterium]|nr:NusG domain II-containing protein [Lachnospiraceae bacterium]